MGAGRRCRWQKNVHKFGLGIGKNPVYLLPEPSRKGKGVQDNAAPAGRYRKGLHVPAWNERIRRQAVAGRANGCAPLRPARPRVPGA